MKKSQQQCAELKKEHSGQRQRARRPGWLAGWLVMGREGVVRGNAGGGMGSDS